MNILGPACLEGASVLDLYAGTGAVGIETLSREAAHVTFVESARAALEALRRNLETLGLDEEAARVVRADVLAVLKAPRPLPGEPFDLVFCDPPYAVFEGGAREARLAAGLAALVARGAVAADAILVVEHPAGRGFADDPEGWQRTDERRWSRAGASLYARRASP